MKARRHIWEDVGLRERYFVQRCKRCPVHRREKVGGAGAQVFEFSTDGTTYTKPDKVPECTGEPGRSK